MLGDARSDERLANLSERKAWRLNLSADLARLTKMLAQACLKTLKVLGLVDSSIYVDVA